MATVIIEQFNPITQCWNKLYDIDAKDFNPNDPIGVNKYNGPYRHRIIGELISDIVEDEIDDISEDEIVDEEPEVFDDLEEVDKAPRLKKSKYSKY